jgi:hypothetical protein
MSIAAMSARWLCRKLRQLGERTQGRHGRYLPTVVCTENLNADVMVMKSAEQGV